MRMIEVNDLFDIFRLLVRLNKEYNGSGQNPISLVLFDGHGTSDRLHLGGGQGGRHVFGGRHLSTPRFKSLFQKYLYKTFARHSQFIFGSCDAARYPNSVAQTFESVMKSILGERVRVAGSEGDITPFSDITPSLHKDGSLELACEFEEGGTRFRDL